MQNEALIWHKPICKTLLFLTCQTYTVVHRRKKKLVKGLEKSYEEWLRLLWLDKKKNGSFWHCIPSHFLSVILQSSHLCKILLIENNRLSDLFGFLTTVKILWKTRCLSFWWVTLKVLFFWIKIIRALLKHSSWIGLHEISTLKTYRSDSFASEQLLVHSCMLCVFERYLYEK